MKQAINITFTFEDPNSPAGFEALLQKILVDKLLAEFAYPEYLPSAG